jgi:hypothetical protein
MAGWAMNGSNVLRTVLALVLVVAVAAGSIALFGPIGIVLALVVLGAIWALGAVLRTPGTPTA